MLYSMMLMERCCDYPELLESLRGRSVLIWSCSICASLCNGIGSKASAESLSDRLTSDGIDVKGIIMTGAACIMSKVRSTSDDSGIDGSDVILALSCNMGADNISRVTGKDVMNPIITIGYGYLDDDGIPRLPDGSTLSSKSSPF